MNIVHNNISIYLIKNVISFCHWSGWFEVYKRSKVPDYKDKHVFGVPPIVNVQRNWSASASEHPAGDEIPTQPVSREGLYVSKSTHPHCFSPLPLLISNSSLQVGIFRKSGVKSRIQALRQLNENSPDHVTYQGQSAYDVADLIKQYFRDLPEPVLTSKLTDTFLHVYQCKWHIFLMFASSLFFYVPNASLLQSALQLSPRCVCVCSRSSRAAFTGRAGSRDPAARWEQRGSTDVALFPQWHCFCTGKPDDCGESGCLFSHPPYFTWMPQRKMELHQGVCGSSFAFIRGPAKVPYKKSHFA